MTLYESQVDYQLPHSPTYSAKFEIMEAKTVGDFNQARKLLLEYGRLIDYDYTLGREKYKQELANLPGDYSRPNGFDFGQSKRTSGGMCGY